MMCVLQPSWQPNFQTIPKHRNTQLTRVPLCSVCAQPRYQTQTANPYAHTACLLPATLPRSHSPPPTPHHPTGSPGPLLLIPPACRFGCRVYIGHAGWGPATYPQPPNACTCSLRILQFATCMQFPNTYPCAAQPVIATLACPSTYRRQRAVRGTTIRSNRPLRRSRHGSLGSHECP